MKRIDATIQATNWAVLDALKDIVGGFSILEGNGRGSRQRQTIRAGRDTDSIVAEHNKIATVSTVVDDSAVEKISTAIAGQFIQEKVEM